MAGGCAHSHASGPAPFSVLAKPLERLNSCTGTYFSSVIPEKPQGETQGQVAGSINRLHTFP